MSAGGNNSGQHFVGIEPFDPLIRSVSRFGDGIAPPRPELSAPLVLCNSGISEERFVAGGLTTVERRQSLYFDEDVVFTTRAPSVRSCVVI
jgi:hypothetical protein